VSVFEKRVNLKPYEYPELLEYVDAVRHSYWVHTEFNYTSDVQDFKTKISDKERNTIINTMLAIAQVEVAVKTFWGDIYKKMPKPEIGAVGATFAESEVRHMDAYAHLLEILGLNGHFKELSEVPAIRKRVEYLDDILAISREERKDRYPMAVLLFSLFIEHVSLFSQFLVMMSFNKHKNLFKGLSNAVEATSKEEQVHGMFGIDIINIIRKEHPEFFTEEVSKEVKEMCEKVFEAEKEVVEWMFQGSDPEFLSRTEVLEFIKHRMNKSLKATGFDEVFVVDNEALEKTSWFDEEVIATKHVDFFYKRSINYNKRSQSVTGEDLF
jgi:ribonucleoside-diphosphate reductase beta chain